MSKSTHKTVSVPHRVKQRLRELALAACLQAGGFVSMSEVLCGLIAEAHRKECQTNVKAE